MKEEVIHFSNGSKITLTGVQWERVRGLYLDKKPEWILLDEWDHRKEKRNQEIIELTMKKLNWRKNEA